MNLERSIFIVDDDPLMLVVLRRHLAPLGHGVFLARNREETMAGLAEHGAPTLVVLDVNMPDIDGRELAREIREAHPGTKVLFMSGTLHDGLTTAKLRPDGAFLRKPFSAQEFRETVSSLIED